jgi:hypothetical protein
MSKPIDTIWISASILGRFPQRWRISSDTFWRIVLFLGPVLSQRPFLAAISSTMAVFQVYI